MLNHVSKTHLVGKLEVALPVSAELFCGPLAPPSAAEKVRALFSFIQCLLALTAHAQLVVWFSPVSRTVFASCLLALTANC